jgi:hypothetical protein
MTMFGFSWAEADGDEASPSNARPAPTARAVISLYFMKVLSSLLAKMGPTSQLNKRLKPQRLVDTGRKATGGEVAKNTVASASSKAI